MSCTDLGCPGIDPRCPPARRPPGFPAPGGCGCAPLVSTGAWGFIPPGSGPAWSQLVPIITLRAGSSVLRSTRVAVYANPLNRPTDELGDCDICADFVVSYLHASTEFVLDGRDRRAYLRCPGRDPVSGARLLSGGYDGGPFRWPVLDCGGGYSILVTTDAVTVAPDASFSIATVTRTPA